MYNDSMVLGIIIFSNLQCKLTLAYTFVIKLMFDGSKALFEYIM